MNDNTRFPWNRLAHVMDAFAIPTSGGALTFPDGQRGGSHQRIGDDHVVNEPAVVTRVGIELKWFLVRIPFKELDTRLKEAEAHPPRPVTTEIEPGLNPCAHSRGPRQAGAIGIASNLVFTRRYKGVSVSPTAGAGQPGLSITVTW